MMFFLVNKQFLYYILNMIKKFNDYIIERLKK